MFSFFLNNIYSRLLSATLFIILPTGSLLVPPSLSGLLCFTVNFSYEMVGHGFNALWQSCNMSEKSIKKYPTLEIDFSVNFHRKRINFCMKVS